MRCHICDQPLDNPRLDPRDGSYQPCTTCQEHIDDALSDFEEEQEEEVNTLNEEQLQFKF